MTHIRRVAAPRRCNGRRRATDKCEWRHVRPRRGSRVRFLIFFTIAVLLAGYAYQTVEETIKPALESAAEIKTREAIEKIVIAAVNDMTSGSGTLKSEDIICTKADSSGKISMVTLNTSMLNLAGTEIAAGVNEAVSGGTSETLRINIGTLMGSRLLSQFLPYVSFSVAPVAVSDVSYATEFESVGINQTKYKVYMNVTTEARVLVPFMSENIVTENTVLVAESVIVGDVPDTFANIPQDELSDFVS